MELQILCSASGEANPKGNTERGARQGAELCAGVEIVNVNGRHRIMGRYEHHAESKALMPTLKNEQWVSKRIYSLRQSEKGYGPS